MENMHEILKELDLGTDLELITKDFDKHFEGLALYAQIMSDQSLHPSDYYYRKKENQQ